VTALACLAHVKDLAASMPPTGYLNKAAGTTDLVVAGIVAEVAIPKVIVADVLWLIAEPRPPPVTSTA
jgi:hypothetical protein